MTTRPDFNRIKATTDIVAVIEACGIALKREGKDHVGLCPFHQDTTAMLARDAKQRTFSLHALRRGRERDPVRGAERKSDRTRSGLEVCGSIPGVQRGSNWRQSQRLEKSSSRRGG